MDDHRIKVILNLKRGTAPPEPKVMHLTPAEVLLIQGLPLQARFTLDGMKVMRFSSDIRLFSKGPGMYSVDQVGVTLELTVLEEAPARVDFPAEGMKQILDKIKELPTKDEKEGWVKL